MRASPGPVSALHECFGLEAGAEEWDRVVYAPGTYESFIWGMEREALLGTVTSLATRRRDLAYLDFACGTGRVLEAVTPYVGRAVGIDIAAPMLRFAAAKVPSAEIKQGDVLCDERLLDPAYDLITAFRFFLNCPPELRLPILATLASRLRDADSRLVFNVHASRHSLAGLNSLGGRANAMSYREIRRLITRAGLEVESWQGFGFGPACRQRLRPLRSTMALVDSWAARRRPLRWASRDLFFVCRPDAG